MSKKTSTIVGMGVLTAIVVVLQLLAVAFPVYPFTITLSLVPMLVGAALYGWWAGAWLGFVFGFVVVLTNAQAFLAVNPVGTVIVCLLKGIAAGAVAGLIYHLLTKLTKNTIVSTLVAAVIEPIVNTGIFLLGCLIFFMPTIQGWADAAGFENAGKYMIFGLVGTNFLIEMAVNIILSTAIVQIVKVVKKQYFPSVK